MNDRIDRLTWIDLETTGFEPGTSAPGDHAILELGIVITEADLTVVASRSWVVWQPPSVLARMDDHVRKMHTASGLLDEVAAIHLSDDKWINDKCVCNVDDVAGEALLFLRNHVDPRTSPLCGSSVWFDHGFLIRDMPYVRGHLHYRMIDVSTIKELARRWCPGLEPAKKLAHRALPDLRETLAEAALYRDMIFARPDPSWDLGERDTMADRGTT